MRDNKKASDVQLNALYEAAVAFKQAAPWTMFHDSDVIYVANPKDNSLSYCSIMGNAGQHYALGVYLGEKGLLGLQQMTDYGNAIPKHQLLHIQDCLMCSFEDRDFLSTVDRKQIKDFGLSFRGKDAWPLFRRYEPGFAPWYINEEECVLLTHALNQVLYVAINTSNEQLEKNDGHGMVTLRYSKEKDGSLEWLSTKTDRLAVEISYKKIMIKDDIQIHKIKKAGVREGTVFEIDTLYLPSAIQDNKENRPYYPRICMFIEKATKEIIEYEVYNDIKEDASVTINKLIDLCLEHGVPEEIHVRGDAMVAMLGDFCKRTGIALKARKRLPLIDKTMLAMEEI